MSGYSYEETKDAQRCNHEFPDNDFVEYKTKKKIQEKEYLDKLVDDHWKYIEGVLWAASISAEDEGRIEEIRFHYKTAAKHFWGHCREYHVGDTL